MKIHGSVVRLSFIFSHSPEENEKKMSGVQRKDR